MNNAIDIPSLTNVDRRVIQLAEHEIKDWTRKCFEAAFFHLEQAHKIVELDPAMAMFRSITAEEEAATGLLRALQSLKYPRADKLLVRNHLHKAAVYPFILSVIKHASYLKVGGVETVQLGISKDEEPPRLRLALILDGRFRGLIARPEPPLNLKLTEGDDNQPPDYRRYLLELLDAGGYTEIRKYFERKANQRNLLLYASPRGLARPSIDLMQYLTQQKCCVVTILKAALLIWPYKEIQPFVTDLIEAFLISIQKVQNEMSHIDV